ncbi:MAG: response regulator transcription factor [Chloroflexota bacterium]|nr:response regulator transcription factor [Chloroflexota bacterium]
MPPIRILVVDDSPTFLSSLAQLLASLEEFEVVGTALSASGAIEQIAQSHPDLVLMDMVMPDMNGLEATRLVKAEPDAPRVIICTLYATTQYEEAAKAAGADGFLPKSALSKKLLHVAQSFLKLYEG